MYILGTPRQVFPAKHHVHNQPPCACGRRSCPFVAAQPEPGGKLWREPERGGGQRSSFPAPEPQQQGGRAGCTSCQELPTNQTGLEAALVSAAQVVF